jgi:hypothetical protein
MAKLSRFFATAFLVLAASAHQSSLMNLGRGGEEMI